MAHKHSVYDTDLHFKIDNVTRNITSESGKVILMQNDHNSERFTFEIPRMVDGHDMSLCNIVEVHYINTDSTNKRNQTKEVYPVQDLQLSPDSDDVVICSWLVSGNATMYAGTLHFVIRYACVAEDGTIDYQWFTNIYSVITIAQGILNTDVVTDDGDPDILYAWKREMDDLVRPYYEAAVKSATNAAVSETNAKTSEENAAVSETNAKTSEENAAMSETNARVSEENAKTYEINAKTSEVYAASAVSKATNLNDETLENIRGVRDAVEEYNARIGNTSFNMNLETGNLEYESPDYIFYVNEETGDLEWETLHEHSETVDTIIHEVRNDKSDAIVQTAAGENIVVNDSSNDPFRGLRIFGKTEQFSTTGKNLFNINAEVVIDKVSYVRDAVSATITTGAKLNEDGYARIMFENIKVDAAKTYTISFDTDSTVEIMVGWYGCSKTVTTSGKTHYSATLSNITTATFSVGTTVPNTTVKFSNIQIEEGTVETSYEPYTGGVASPNPNYRQRLKSIGVGKNLLQNTAKNLTYGGVTFIVNDDGSVTANGTATEILFFKINSIELKKNVAYVLNGCPSGGSNSSYSIKCDLTGTGALDTGSGVTIIGDGKKDCPINIRIAEGATVKNLVFKPMVRYVDVEDGMYEQYGENNIEVGVYGKNLLTVNLKKGEKITLTASKDDYYETYSNIYADLKAGESYLLTINSDGVWGRDKGSDTVEILLLKDCQYQHIMSIDNLLNKPFTVPVDGRYHVRFDVNKNGCTHSFWDIMIRKAEIIDDTYEPHKAPQTLTALTPNGLPAIPVTDASIATYTDQNGVMWRADEIDFERGMYVRRVKSILVDGSTPIERRYVVNSSTKARFKVLDISDVPAPADQTSKGLAMCDKLPRVSASNTYNAIEGISIDATSNILIYIDSISEMSVEEMSTWLSENPLSIIYGLNNPIEMSLTKEELTQYRALHSNYPATMILNDSDAHMEVKYNADTKSYIDNKLAELVAARMKGG